MDDRDDMYLALARPTRLLQLQREEQIMSDTDTAWLLPLASSYVRDLIAQPCVPERTLYERRLRKR